MVVVAVAMFAGGCATERIDWRRAHAIAVEADHVAAAWQAVLDDDAAKQIGAVREIGRPVIAALAARAADPAADDPTDDLRAWLELATDVAIHWPDDRQRQVAMAVLSSVRVSLIVAGIDLQPPDDSGGGP